MKLNRHNPAFPLEGSFAPSGLTKHEYAAIKLMAGLMADPTQCESTMEDMAKTSIAAADELFRQLEQHNG